jgi:hypothetical protein
MILTSNRGFAERGMFLATLWSPRPCSTDFCIMPSSFKWRDQAEHVRSKALIAPPSFAPLQRPRGRPPKNTQFSTSS